MRKIHLIALVFLFGSLWAQAGEAQAGRVFRNPHVWPSPGQYLSYRPATSNGFGDRMPVLEAYLADPAIVGYFFSESRLRPNGVLLLKQDGKFFIRSFYYRNPPDRGQALPDEFGKALEAVLKNEIFNTVPLIERGFDGRPYAFGVKKDGRWHKAEIWCPKEGTISHLMGRIADSHGRDNFLPILKDIDAFYAQDKRERLDYAAMRAEQDKRYAEWDADFERRKPEYLVRFKDKFSAEIVVPESGDLRMKLTPRDLPEGNDLRVATSDLDFDLYFALSYLDENGETRTWRSILTAYHEPTEDTLPLTQMEIPLPGISQQLRSFVLMRCPDPEKIQGLSLLAQTLTVFQPRDHLPPEARHYSNEARAITLLQALPVENVRKNFRAAMPEKTSEDGGR